MLWLIQPLEDTPWSSPLPTAPECSSGIQELPPPPQKRMNGTLPCAGSRASLCVEAGRISSQKDSLFLSVQPGVWWKAQRCQRSSRAQRQNRATILRTEDWNTTGRARRAADVISKRRSWFVASGALDGFSLCPPFSPFTAPSVSSLLGDLRRLSVYEGVPLRRRECHVSLRDIEALCGLCCTGDRWCLVCLGVWVLCVCACGLKLAGGTDTQPLRQLSWGCQAGIRDQRLPETGATGRSSLQSLTRDLGTH